VGWQAIACTQLHAACTTLHANGITEGFSTCILELICTVISDFWAKVEPLASVSPSCVTLATVGMAHGTDHPCEALM